MSLAEGVARIRKGLFAQYFEVGPAYKLISDTFTEFEKCDLVEIAFLQLQDPHNAVQKNSSYKEFVKIGYVLSSIQRRFVPLSVQS